jgi:predicted heme/steroid binding protein
MSKTATTAVPEPGMQTFTTQELSHHDGLNGNPGYIAINNLVYDVSGV